MSDITARFVADFQPFAQAVEQAQAKLVDFSKGAGTVEQSLSRMTESFSGKKIIQDAQLMARAIEDAGGVSTLTAKQLEVLGAKATEATEKMEKLGIGVPANLQAITDAAKSTSEGFTAFLGKLNIDDAISHPLDTAAGAAKAFAASLGPIGLVLTGATAAAAVFGEQLLKFAEEAGQVGGSLNDMSDKTGIAVPALSRLSAAAQIGGSSLEQVSSSIFMMQRNMAEGGPKVEAGFQRIGLSIGQLRNLSPDQQFLAIAEGLKQVGDHAEFAAAGTEIFGRQFRDLAPLIQKDLSGLIDESEKLGLTWTEHDAKAAEEFEQQSRALDLALQKVRTTIGSELIPLLTSGLSFSANSVGWFLTQFNSSRIVQDINFLNVILGATSEKLKLLSVKPPAGFAQLGDDIDTLTTGLMQEAAAAQTAEIAHDALVKSLKPFNDAFANITDLLAGQGVAWDGTAEQALKYHASVADVATVLGRTKGDIEAVNIGLKAHDDQLKAVAESYKKLTAGLGSDGLSATLHELGQQLTILVPTLTTVSNLLAYVAQNAQTANALNRQLNSTIGLMPDTADAAARHMEKLQGTTEHWTTDLDHLSSTLALVGRVSSGTFGAMATDASQAVRALADMGRAVDDLAQAGSGLSKAAAKGDIIAAAIAAGAAVFDIFKNMFGPSKDELAARDMFKKIQLQGESLTQTINRIGAAYIAQGKTATDAQLDIQRALDATHQSAEAEAAALETINGVLNDQQNDVADTQAAIERYGFTIQELGPAMQKQKLDEQAQQILNDWRLLVGSGIELSTVNEHMASSINDYLKLARQTGQDVPAAMEPILQKMIDAGELTDDAGNKITDLKDIGVSFSETMTQGFDKIVSRLDKLLAGLGLIPKLLDSIPAETDFTINGHYNAPPDIPNYWDSSNAQISTASTGGMVTATGIQHFAMGGRVLPFAARGSDKVPAMLTPGEMVSSVSDTGSMAASLKALSLQVAYQAKTLEAMQKLLTDQARAIGVAVSDAVLLIPRKTA